MDLKRLRTFLAVADSGTLSKAAVGLRTTQPALSRQLAELQRELGLRLFDRVGRHLVLTAGGEQFLADCRGALAGVDALAARAETLRRGDRGVLKVAASPPTIESLISSYLPAFAVRFPKVQVQLTEALGHEQLALLERGEIHIGIRQDQGDHRWLGRQALPPVEILVASGPSLPIGRGKAIELERLQTYPLLLLDEGYSARKTFDAACRLAAIEPAVLFESRAPHTLLALAEAGHGVAIIPSLLDIGRYRLAISRITHRRKALREAFVMQWDGRRPLPAYAARFCTGFAAHMRASRSGRP